MSRIGKEPIKMPSGVKLEVSDDRLVTVSGPKGTLAWDLPASVSVREEGDEVLVERINDERQSKALHGLSRSLLNNMVVGVSEGFVKELEIVGVGYRAQAQGDRKLELQLGFSHPVHIDAPEGVAFEVPSPVSIRVHGADKQAVGQVAASIRALRKPEPYKGKGIRYAGERVIRKAGKAAK